MRLCFTVQPQSDELFLLLNLAWQSKALADVLSERHSVVRQDQLKLKGAA